MHSVIRFLLIGVFLLPLSAWSDEATLRVAFVYNFIKFIEWPEKSQDEAINLCSWQSTDDVDQALTQIKGKSVNTTQVIELLYLRTAEDVSQLLPQCQMLYEPRHSKTFPLPEALPKGLLVVSDEPDADKMGVAISLKRNQQGRIEFSVDENQMNIAGVVVSSQLLKLAKNIKGGQ